MLSRRWFAWWGCGLSAAGLVCPILVGILASDHFRKTFLSDPLLVLIGWNRFLLSLMVALPFFVLSCGGYLASKKVHPMDRPRLHNLFAKIVGAAAGGLGITCYTVFSIETSRASTAVIGYVILPFAEILFMLGGSLIMSLLVLLIRGLKKIAP